MVEGHAADVRSLIMPMWGKNASPTLLQVTYYRSCDRLRIPMAPIMIATNKRQEHNHNHNQNDHEQQYHGRTLSR